MIVSLECKDNNSGWSLNEIKFNMINLIVGISGVGKSKTLNSIMNLKEIARGRSVNGFSWRVQIALEDEVYLWEGKFNTIEQNQFEVLDSNQEVKISAKKSRIVNEKLCRNSRVVFEVSDAGTVFLGKAVPKTNRKSLLSIFSEEEDLLRINAFLNSMILVDFDEETNFGFPENAFHSLTRQINSIEKLKKVDLPVIIKLCALQRIDRKQFDNVKNNFISIFPFVKDIKFDLDKANRNYILFIKEKETGWVEQKEISSGMFKSLLYIAELLLLQKNSVVLIDEFENGLGLNCIHKIANILKSTQDIQFILTSHHPYIINNIELSDWIILSRDGSAVNVKKADELSLGISSHENFKQLINLENYIGGIQ